MRLVLAGDSADRSHHQLSLILDVLGTPTMDEFYAITSRRSKDYIRNMPFRKRRSFESLYPKSNPLAIDFLTKTLTCKHQSCLCIDHSSRPA